MLTNEDVRKAREVARRIREGTASAEEIRQVAAIYESARVEVRLS